jgi:peptide/nickel transport system substrate-binding protein
MDRRSFLTLPGSAAFLILLKALPAEAAEKDTVVVAIADTINSLDINRPGTNRPAYQVAVNAYDRLLSFGTKTNPDGSVSWDYHSLHGELAQSWQIAEDGMSVTFKLKPDATFWDGSKVTADDVKWSLDRAVSIGGFPTTQMGAGRLSKPDQFEVVDPETFRVHFLVKSKLTLPDLAVPVAVIVNSKVAKAHATPTDPWAAEYLHRNPAGSGAFKVERWDPGQQLVYVRNDAWKGGPVPKLRRVIIREIPSQSTRRALVERGDVHLDFDISGKDAKELAETKKSKVIGAPVENAEYVLCPNFGFEPFKDKRVRQAIAYSVPYEQIFQQAAYGIGVRMFGATSPMPATIAWPQPFPYNTDLDRAKALMAQTPYKDGIETTLSLDLSTADWSEPTALLIQENLAKIGIKTTIDRIPGANWRTIALLQKKLPLILDTFGGWLNTPDYYFYWAYVKDHLFNGGNYDNPEMAALVDKTLDMAESNPEYEPSIKRMIQIAFDDVPRIPLWQPNVESAMAQNLQGYVSWFHRVPDCRPYVLT